MELVLFSILKHLVDPVLITVMVGDAPSINHVSHIYHINLLLIQGFKPATHIHTHTHMQTHIKTVSREDLSAYMHVHGLKRCPNHRDLSAECVCVCASRQVCVKRGRADCAVCLSCHGVTPAAVIGRQLPAH